MIVIVISIVSIIIIMEDPKSDTLMIDMPQVAPSLARLAISIMINIIIIISSSSSIIVIAPRHRWPKAWSRESASPTARRHEPWLYYYDCY